MSENSRKVVLAFVVVPSHVLPFSSFQSRVLQLASKKMATTTGVHTELVPVNRVAYPAANMLKDGVQGADPEAYAIMVQVRYFGGGTDL